MFLYATFVVDVPSTDTCNTIRQLKPPQDTAYIQHISQEHITRSVLRCVRKIAKSYYRPSARMEKLGSHRKDFHEI